MKINSKVVVTFLLVLLLTSTLSVNFNTIMSKPEKFSYDVLIINGSVIDGTGSPRFSADIGIKDGKIVAIGDLGWAEAYATEVIDATGLIVSPGFINPHTHPSAISTRPEAMNYIRQGVTLVLDGQCGGSDLNIGESLASLEALEPGIAINYATLIGQGTVRTAVMGSSYDPPTPEEYDEMKELIAKGMQEGAFGLSTGLEYYPGLACTTEEIIEVAKVAAQYGGVYASHLRDEESPEQGGCGGIYAIAEAIEIGEEAGISVEISHIKVNGADMWFKSDEVIAMINEARDRGIDVTYDQYPYDGSATSFTTLLPAWVYEPFEGKEGNAALMARLANPEQRALIKDALSIALGLRVGTEFWRIIVSRCSWNPDFVGQTLEYVMDTWGLPYTSEGAAEAAIQIIENGGASYISRSMNEYDIENFMKQPFHMVCSDGSIIKYGSGSPHPRGYGAFTRILSEYVRERGVLTLEQAVYKMTYMPAEKFGFLELGRGLIREGFWADVVVFNPDTVVDKATYLAPHQYAEGYKAVIVNGEIAVLDDVFQGVYAGQVLRHTQLALEAYIENLPSEALRSEELQKPLVKKAEVVLMMIQKGQSNSAINKLLNDLRSKADGEWVTDPEAQENLCTLIDNLYDLLNMT